MREREIDFAWLVATMDAPANGRRQTMRFDYDPQVDALYIRLNEAKIIESEEVQPGIILDFDENGKVAGVEVLDASKRNTTPAPVRQAA
jgi:uncharacterized protein YuzE